MASLGCIEETTQEVGKDLTMACFVRSQATIWQGTLCTEGEFVGTGR